MNVAALYVDERGTYVDREGVDAWGVTRDARRYVGQDPVVAHPPCQLWVNFAALNFKRYGGEHNRPGNDGGCFAHALAAVRRNGGVLEHPASSNAWPAFGLLRPTAPGWNKRERVDLRGLAICVRPQGEKTHMASLRRRVAAARSAMVS